VGGATTHTPREDDPLQTEGRELAYPKNSIVHLAHIGVDTDHSKEGSKHPESGDKNTSSHLSDAFALKGGRKEEHHRAGSFPPPTSSSSGGDWSHHPSPTTSLPCKGKNIPNMKHGDGGTDAETCGDITKLGNRIQRSRIPGRSLRSRRNFRRVSTPRKAKL
jgi:hypothetical protein